MIRRRKFKALMAGYKKPERKQRQCRVLKTGKYKRMAEVRKRRMSINGGKHSTLEWQNMLESSGHKCAGCGCTDSKLYRDHIMPVCNGGSDDITNIQPLCLRCNFSKAGKYPYVFKMCTV